MKSTTGNAYINKLELDLLCFTTAVIEYYGEERRKKTVFVIGSEKSATLGFQHDKGVKSEKAIGEKMIRGVRRDKQRDFMTRHVTRCDMRRDNSCDRWRYI